FPAIQINRERDVALVSQLRRLFLHPIIQAPPLMNDDESRERPLARWRVQHAGDGFVAALYETDLASAANAHIANNRKANRITVFIMSSPFKPSFSFVAFAVDAFFDLQFHVGRGGNWIVPTRC